MSEHTLSIALEYFESELWISFCSSEMPLATVLIDFPSTAREDVTELGSMEYRQFELTSQIEALHVTLRFFWFQNNATKNPLLHKEGHSS